MARLTFTNAAGESHVIEAKASEDALGASIIRDRLLANVDDKSDAWSAGVAVTAERLARFLEGVESPIVQKLRDLTSFLMGDDWRGRCSITVG